MGLSIHPSQPKRPVRRLGEILVERGAVTSEQVEGCLRIQKLALMQSDSRPRLGELLIKQGHATEESISLALALQEKTIVACQPCGKRFNVLGYDPGKVYRCRSCKGTVLPLSEVNSVVVQSGDLALGMQTPGSSSRPPSERKAPETPTVPLGKYTVLRQIGRGGMGVVYEAVDTELGRKVALKMMLDSPGADSKELKVEEERFLREARACARLEEHPNLISVYEAGVIDGRRFLAMELVKGKQFDVWRKTGSITIRQQVALLRDVTRAVHHAHEAGIIHRDLKPQNILVDGKNQPHVMDFGLAKELGQDVSMTLTAKGMVIGTPAYMSPEQAKGFSKSIDQRSDVYALGAMLYETLAGRPPFKGTTAVDILMKVVNEKPIPPSDVVKKGQPVDPVLENICLKALEKERNNRYPTAKAMADDLTRWLKRQTVQGIEEHP